MFIDTILNVLSNCWSVLFHEGLEVNIASCCRKVRFATHRAECRLVNMSRLLSTITCLADRCTAVCELKTITTTIVLI